MTGLSKARVLVAGGGAFGAAIALELAQAGAAVTLVDPGGPNASAVAAGMLAPAFECVLDPEGALPFELLRTARDLWPALARRLKDDVGLTRGGAVWLDLPGEPVRAEAIAQGLTRIGAALAAPPKDAPAGAAVFTPDDWRLEPRRALAALRGQALALGGEAIRARLLRFEGGRAWLSNGDSLPVDRIVLATGAEGGELAPELADLVPIKGQILKYPRLGSDPGLATIRCAGGYAAAGEDGLCVGATMQSGVRDLAPDPEVTARLHALAARLHPQVAGLTPAAETGVRAATPDGPPRIGPSAREGVFLAIGARRNGWLLAPLVAQVTAAYLAGRDPGPQAAGLIGRRPVAV